MRLVSLILIFSQGLWAQNPFDLIDQYETQKNIESFSKILEDNGYYAVPENNIDTEQHYRSGNANVFLTSGTCNHIVISSTNTEFSKSIESELEAQRQGLTESLQFGRTKLSWLDKLNNRYFVLVNPNGKYELYYESCSNNKPLSQGQP